MHPAENNEYCVEAENLTIINSLDIPIYQSLPLSTTTPAPQTTPGVIPIPTTTTTTTTTPSPLASQGSNPIIINNGP